MKKIPLTKNQVAVIDDSDFVLVGSINWQYLKNKNALTGYASGCIPTGKRNPPRILMHRLILDVLKEPVQVDHIDGDGLNNQRSNLRLATCSQNMQNRKSLSTNRSGFKGVSWHMGASKWQVHIKKGKDKIYLGLFDSKEEAALVYNNAAKSLFGEFANLNEL